MIFSFHTHLLYNEFLLLHYEVDKWAQNYIYNNFWPFGVYKLDKWPLSPSLDLDKLEYSYHSSLNSC